MLKKLTISAFLFLAITGNVFAQELTPEDAKRIKPFPPVGLTLECASGGISVSWKPHALQSVSRYGHYVVYRSRNDVRFVKLAVVKQSIQFTDKKSRKGDSYAISAVNVYKVESQLSTAVKLKTVCKPKP